MFFFVVEFSIVRGVGGGGEVVLRSFGFFFAFRGLVLWVGFESLGVFLLGRVLLFFIFNKFGCFWGGGAFGGGKISVGEFVLFIVNYYFVVFYIVKLNVFFIEGRRLFLGLGV